MNSIDYRVIPIEELKINPWEVANRLNVPRNFDSDEIDRCFKELKKVINCKISAVRISVKRLSGNRLDCGFGEFSSETLLKNLKDCKEAFVFAATIGMGVDRLLEKLSRISPAKHFVTDALASAVAEALADKAEEILCEGFSHRPRFSPGFGDLSIELQPRILGLVGADRLLGITVNDAYLMAPVKSVTAFIGIE